MRPATRAAALAVLGATLVLFLFVAPRAAGEKSQGPPQVTVLFAVEEAPGLASHWIEPIATLEGDSFRPVPVSCDDSHAAAAGAFFSRYLAQGHAYPLLYGGKQIGRVLPTGQADPLGSPGSLANLQVSGGTRPPAAIATNSASLARPQGRRRDPTPGERQQATDLAKQIFRQHKVTEADLARLRADGVAMADLEGHGEFALIATFVVPTTDGAGIQDSLFFAFKPGGSEPLIWYDHPASTSQGEELLFVDQLPLRPGEPDDLLVHAVYYRNSSYRIYRFHIISWRPIFETPVYGCL